MKKIITATCACIMLISMVSCNKFLDIAPESSVSESNFWKTADQANAFVSGVHTRFRSHVQNLLFLGELRADIHGTDPGTSSAFTGESTGGNERLWNNTLSLDAPGVASYGGFYSNINQLNILINRVQNTTVLTESQKNYFLGIGYGMRAFYYFKLYMSWNNVIIQTEPTADFNVFNLAKAASPGADVLALVKDDIEKSLTSFGSDYSFQQNKGYWSKAATLMLKAEVFLWTAHRDGGIADATAARNALTDIQSNIPSLALQSNFANVFATTNRGNAEVIFASRFLLNEATLPITNHYPQNVFIINYYDSLQNRKFDASTDNWGGTLFIPMRAATFRRFNDRDSRKWASIQPAYRLNSGQYELAGVFTVKFKGEQSAGVRVYTNDYIIYRYADLLLLLAEAKQILGESPADEINQVRKRAFGAAYNADTDAFPNQATDADPVKAILEERYFEFTMEGKRWFDLRRAGDQYVYEYTNITPDESYKLLWPVDRNTLTNNKLLEQSPGYPSF